MLCTTWRLAHIVPASNMLFYSRMDLIGDEIVDTTRRDSILPAALWR